MHFILSQWMSTWSTPAINCVSHNAYVPFYLLGWVFGFGIFARRLWMSFFSSYDFHNSKRLMTYRAISWIFSMSTFSSANQDLRSFCRITQAICRQPWGNTGKVSLTGYTMSNGNRMWKTTVNHCLFSAAISNPLPGGWEKRPSTSYQDTEPQVMIQTHDFMYAP